MTPRAASASPRAGGGASAAPPLAALDAAHAARVPALDPVPGPLPWSGADAGDAAGLLAAYERMLLIRRFEEDVQRQFLQGAVHGTTHLCIGEEAIPVGIATALRDGDLLAATYRGHGHALALGVEPEGLMAEMMGRATGTCGGRAGSMNVIDLEHGLIGCFGIVGGTLAAATGAALGLRARQGVAVACFGEGTANQAYFAECLNFARVLELPVLFVCENNLYGEYTPWERVTAGQDVKARAEVLDIPARRIDGNDVRAVHAAATEAVERAREGRGPTFLECVTYRHVGHSRSDPARYRPDGELDAWRERDPIPATRTLLTDGLQLPEADVAAAEARVEAQLTTAVEAALAAPYPDPDDLVEEYRDAA
jgi:TPP-dependent pyruvate/acetoin dehydrogenase alpha subunit